MRRAWSEKSAHARPSERVDDDDFCLMNRHREFASRTFGGEIGLPAGSRPVYSLIAGRVNRIRPGIILNERK
jgi:hypothetical protein